MKKKCSECEKEFTPNYPNSRYCSPECREIATARRKKQDKEKLRKLSKFTDTGVMDSARGSTDRRLTAKVALECENQYEVEPLVGARKSRIKGILEEHKYAKEKLNKQLKKKRITKEEYDEAMSLLREKRREDNLKIKELRGQIAVLNKCHKYHSTYKRLQDQEEEIDKIESIEKRYQEEIKGYRKKYSTYTKDALERELGALESKIKELTKDHTAKRDLTIIKCWKKSNVIRDLLQEV